MVDLVEPRIEQWDAQPYAAVRVTVALSALAPQLGVAWPKVFGWLYTQGANKNDVPLIRYRQNLPDGWCVDIGIPADNLPQVGDDEVVVDHRPPGRYAVADFFGDYGLLLDANAALQQWLDARGLQADVSYDGGEHWAGRFEYYVTDPQSVPDPSRWHTRLAHRLSD